MEEHAEKNVLGEVLEVERQIKERLRVEKKKADEWLESVKGEALERVAVEEERLKEEYERAARDAGEAARRKAVGILREAEGLARGFHNMDDEALRRIVMRHLARILPERK